MEQINYLEQARASGDRHLLAAAIELTVRADVGSGSTKFDKIDAQGCREFRNASDIDAFLASAGRVVASYKSGGALLRYIAERIWETPGGVEVQSLLNSIPKPRTCVADMSAQELTLHQLITGGGEITHIEFDEEPKIKIGQPCEIWLDGGWTPGFEISGFGKTEGRDGELLIFNQQQKLRTGRKRDGTDTRFNPRSSNYLPESDVQVVGESKIISKKGHDEFEPKFLRMADRLLNDDKIPSWCIYGGKASIGEQAHQLDSAARVCFENLV
jgi:hypothetical protein